MESELSTMTRLAIIIVIPIMMIALFCGVTAYSYKINSGQYIESNEFTVTSKHTETSNRLLFIGKIISSIYDTDYIVELDNEKYGKIEIENTDLYNNIESGSTASIKVYKKTNGSYKFIW